MRKLSLNPLKKRHYKLKSRQNRRKARSRVARGTLGLGVLFVVLALTILTSNAKRVMAQETHRPVLTIPKPEVIEDDAPGRALDDPNADPYDDGTLRRSRCPPYTSATAGGPSANADNSLKEGPIRKEGKEGLVSGCRNVDGILSPGRGDTVEVSIPAPGPAGLLAFGLLLTGLGGWLRKPLRMQGAKA